MQESSFHFHACIVVSACRNGVPGGLGTGPGRPGNKATSLGCITSPSFVLACHCNQEHIRTGDTSNYVKFKTSQNIIFTASIKNSNTQVMLLSTHDWWTSVLFLDNFTKIWASIELHALTLATRSYTTLSVYLFLSPPTSHLPPPTSHLQIPTSHAQTLQILTSRRPMSLFDWQVASYAMQVESKSTHSVTGGQCVMTHLT